MGIVTLCRFSDLNYNHVKCEKPPLRRTCLGQKSGFESAQRYCILVSKFEIFYSLTFSIRLICTQLSRIILIFGGIFGGILGGNNPPKNLQVKFGPQNFVLTWVFTWDSSKKNLINLLIEIIKKFLKFCLFSKISKNFFFL